ncbi:hypothetical protein GYMLUDRAFT_244581 [Collybiopsis luxurians FD-317 M1]|uniref:Endoplasmic reticulum vesicle transporter C-terminal domain-containing protein n=1 Tax=Collybiopsis luxurians FD-317 M1 TaxID=944289 RepID=A0A0D0CCA9_9AGAR|nr:hypothetical protein GYMLUDRAFT_244581 [Collybiopsis luxurians FD-317 M1]
MLNDIGEFIWRWLDYEFSGEYALVDLGDAIGDRLSLSRSGLKRDGTRFDIGQATKLKEHAPMLSATQAIAQSRKACGFFDTILRRTSKHEIAPTYDHPAHPSACRVYGTIEVKKLMYVFCQVMNLSHVITEFSFGPHFPDIVQPLDYSFELAKDPFVAYQYFLHVVPTTYIAPRSTPLHTHQYSVTHYTRVMQHGEGTPGIFFKFDLDPMSLTIHQRTTTFTQLLIRCAGVIGGVFVCMSYAIRIGTRAVQVVTGSEDEVIVAASSSGAKAGLRSKWGGGELRSRKMIRQGSGWTMESAPGSPAISVGGGGGYGSYANTPVSSTFSPAASPYLASPSFNSPMIPSSSNPGTPNPSATSFGPPPSAPRSRPSSLYHSRTPGGSMSISGSSLSSAAFPVSNDATAGSPATGAGVPGAVGSAVGAGSNFPPSIPGTPSYAMFPPTPNPANGNGSSGFPTGPPPRRTPSGGSGKKDD